VVRTGHPVTLSGTEAIVGIDADEPGAWVAEALRRVRR
jgi:hypothetical protein